MASTFLGTLWGGSHPSILISTGHPHTYLVASDPQNSTEEGLPSRILQVRRWRLWKGEVALGADPPPPDVFCMLSTPCAEGDESSNPGLQTNPKAPALLSRTRFLAGEDGEAPGGAALTCHGQWRDREPLDSQSSAHPELGGEHALLMRNASVPDGEFLHKAFPSPASLGSGSPTWDRLLYQQKPSPAPPRMGKRSPVCSLRSFTRAGGMPSQATAFLLSFLSKLAIPPPLPALRFFICKSTVSKIVVFEATAKRLGDERNPRDAELPE